MRHSQFPLDNGILYFNHAAVGPWPQCAVEAIAEFSQQNLHTGSTHYPAWVKTETALRELLRQLINAESADDIALLKNTSEGLSVIAYGLEWHRGDNIIIPADEFPSNRIVWQSLRQFGVETREVDIRNVANPEQALLDAMDKKTRLLSVSAVQYTDGFRLDLPKLGQELQSSPAIFVVDAIQQIGALPFNIQQIKADFVVADGHKWMLGPEGLALFYSHPASRERLNLHQYGWRMIENPTDFNQINWEIAKTARCFECGSPNMLAIHALHASTRLLLQTGMENIKESILSNTDKILEYIDNNDKFTVASSLETKRRSGIILIRHQQLDSEALFTQLTQSGVQCAVRGGGVRLSPHFYHQDQEFEALFAQLSTI